MSGVSRVYLDHAASTPLDPRVASAMAEVAVLPGNASSVHAEGRELRRLIDIARKDVAKFLGANDSEIVFTSGATEANGSAIRGVLAAVRLTHPNIMLRVAVSGVEHASVLGSVNAAREEGVCTIDVIPADRGGVITAEAVQAAMTPETVIVAVQWVNNVLGTMHQVADIGALVKEERVRRGAGGLPIVFVCDAVQAARALEIRVAEIGADILTISGHKIYGPKGIGAMRIAPGVPFRTIAGGGGHESGRRHGTENVAGIVGIGKAAAILSSELEVDIEHMRSLSERLLTGLARSASGMIRVGESCVSGTVFLKHLKLRGDELALSLDMAGVAVSSGSACDAGTRKSPRVLESVLDEQAALRGGIRVSFGRGSSESDIDRLLASLRQV